MRQGRESGTPGTTAGGGMREGRRRIASGLAACFAAATAFLLAGAAGGPETAQAQAADPTLTVLDAKTGLPVTSFKWMVNEDNSHEDSSVTNPQSFSPPLATGEVMNDADGQISIPAPPTSDPLARGYLVTVLANDGVGTVSDPDYKIGGAHFTASDTEVVVELQPHPLPLATLKVRVFHDRMPVNAEDDIPLEPGLAGFHVTLEDPVGEVVTDWYGNPICTTYKRDADGNVVFDAEGNPVIDELSEGFCLTGPDGYATIPFLGPDKYEVQAIPPDGSGWIQVTTIEGTLAIDAWVEEGADGFSTEEGFTQALVWFGFVKPCSFGDLTDNCTSETANTDGTGTITGRIRTIAIDNEAPQLTLGPVVPRPYIALNNIGGNDEQVWTGRGLANGTFTIPDVPAGLYQLAAWDRPLDHIINFRTVRVSNGEVVSMGDIGIPRWFGRIHGSVYVDTNENGIRDPGERGLPGFDLDTRFKDGTIQYATFSDLNGNYEHPEVFELEHFTITEVGYGRFKNTGAASYLADEFGNPIDYPNGPVNVDLGLAGLLQATITWGGFTNVQDWGKKAFDTSGCTTPDPDDACENGGIVGILFNATTRNELDARLQAAEDYEPGIPGGTVNLYAPVLDEDGEPMYNLDSGEVLKDHLVNVYSPTDDWYANRPADCIPTASLGREPDEIAPPTIFPECVELPSLLNQMRPGVFDGGYAFEEDCSSPTPGNMDPDNLECTGESLQAGQYVVEAVPPEGYRAVMEEDINVFSGDVFEPPPEPAIPPPPCAGPLHTVNVVDAPADANFDPNDPSHTQGVYNPDFLATTGPLSPNGGSPYEGQRKPLCNERLVTLENGFNANSDFFVFTDVPAPGRIRGVLLDDLVLELDPESPMYAEKRGIPNTPVGIYDYSGRHITTVYSDENGYWEVLLPSTGTYNCPLPAGPCFGMYQVIGNDPGSPQDPNVGWNPNYGALRLVFDVLPGKTTYADVAILPITGFVQAPSSQFEVPPVCEIGEGTPNIQQVSTPVGPTGTTLTITGAGFGASQGGGGVTLDGSPVTVNSWSDTSINVTIPGPPAPGPKQLLVTAGNGEVSPIGITFHVTGPGYSPTQRHVGAGQPYATIQAALDDATDGDLIVVHPGVYFETLLVDERVKIQGYGPNATVVDGRFFNFGGITADAFAAKIAATAYDGPATVPMGQVFTILAEDGELTSAYNAQIDGFAIRGGTRVRGNRVLASQGGAVYAHAYARYLEVSNNLIQSNAGNFGGGIVLGRAFTDNPDAGGARDMENDFVSIHQNRILNNGGIGLAGGIGIFNGAEGYAIVDNVICGNYSAEYGAGISQYGYSSGSIRDNEVLFNYAFDEGGGIMLAGEQPRNPNAESAGSGDVTVERNRVQGNVSNDDGGGIRLLQPVAGHIRIVNNMVVNNLATDHGGGFALDDALDVEIVNNTVARNISTSTAEDAPDDDDAPPPPSPGARVTVPQGAGLTSEVHSAALLDAIADGEFDCGVVNCVDEFSNPVLFNNIFWENESFYLDGNIGTFGGGLPSAGIRDFEVFDSPGDSFTNTNSICTAFNAHCADNGTNSTAEPQFVEAITTDFEALAFVGDPSFVTVIINSEPGDSQGNYHIAGSSPAVDRGTPSFAGVAAPTDDFDHQARGCPDSGADETGGAEECGPPVPTMIQYMSFAAADSVFGVSFEDEDVIGYDGTGWGMVFDGSDVGLDTPGGLDLDAFALLDADSLLMSFDTPKTLVPLGLVDDSDIVRFDATSLGATTAGVFSIYFDGSDVGLTTGAEDVNALERNGLGRLLITLSDTGTAQGITANDEDILRFMPTSLGSTTSGTWSFLFDGSDVGLGGANEDIDALANGSGLFLSTTAAFSVPGLSGANEDVFRCTQTLVGQTTACTWSAALIFDGSTFGLTDNLDAYERRMGVLP